MFTLNSRFFNPNKDFSLLLMSFFNRKTFSFLFLVLLMGACSQSKLVTSTYTPAPIQIDGFVNDWPRHQVQTQGTSEYDIYFSNDADFLYVFIALKNNQIYQDIQKYGLNLYFDNNRRFRRSFGLVYPTGILNVLSNVPGARKEYLENPSWENLPENRRMIESIQAEMPNRVMLLQRNDKKDPVRAVPVSIEALRAQQIGLAMNREDRLMNIELRIPLQLTRSQQFAIDAKPGDVIYIGFEVSPPKAEEIMDDNTYSASQGGTLRGDPYGRDPYGSNRQSMSRLQNQLRGEFSRWVRVQLQKE